MGNFFSWVFVALALISLGLGTPAWADSEPRPPGKTAKILEEMSEILGPDWSSLLYQDSLVLTVAGVQPFWFVGSESLEQPEDKASSLEALGNKYGLDIRLDYQGLKVTHRERLQSYASDSKLSWMVPYSQTEGFDAWVERLNESAGTVTVGTVTALFLAAPDFVVSTEYRSPDSLLLADRAVKLSLTVNKRLLCKELDLRVLPEDANKPELRSWVSEREEYLERFFAQKQVQQLVQSRAFLKARKRAWKQEPDMNFLESWWNREGLEYFYLLSYADGELRHYEEQVFQESFQELIPLVREGRDPQSWLHLLNRKCYQAGYPPTIQGKQLAAWIWYGAFKKNPARTALYEAVKSSKPDYFPSVVKAKLENWSNYYSGGPGFVASHATERLFRHPETRRYFGALPPQERDTLRLTLEPYLEHQGCREVLTQAPYGLKYEKE